MSADLAADSMTRRQFDARRQEIADLLATQPDIPFTQDSLAGFFHGFMIGGMYFASHELTEQQNDAMFPVLGGIYLLAAPAPRCPAHRRSAMRSGPGSFID
jgi:hypothetical protein